jgi:hypothetical protein
MLLLAIAILAVYAGVLGHEFLVLDDRAWIVNNEQVQSGLSAEGVKWAFETRFGGAWQPVVWISWMGVRTVFGEGPLGFHLTNVVMHLVATLLLFSAFRRLLGSTAIPLLVAALYALHPVQVESVAWAAERKGLMAAIFWMLAMEFYSRHVERPRWSWQLGIFLSMLLGLMAKSTLLALPFALLLLDVWPRNRLALRQGWRPMLQEKAPLFALVPVFVLVGYRAQADFGAVRDVVLLERIPTVAVAYLRSLGHLFAPLDLAPMYAAPPGGFSLALVAGSLVVLVAATVVIHRFRCSLPALWIGWVWFLVTLLPFSGIVAVGGHFMADRYLLIPSIGIWLGLAHLLQAVLDSRGVRARPRWIAAGLVVLVLGGLTVRQVGYWKDSTTLFTHALRTNPDNYLAAYWLGEARAAEQDFDAAAGHFHDARRTNPAYDLAWFQEGAALARLQRHQEAVLAYEGYLALRPRQFKGWMNLGVAYGNLGRNEDALRCFERAAEIAPGDQRARAARDQLRAMLQRRSEGSGG